MRRIAIVVVYLACACRPEATSVAQQDVAAPAPELPRAEAAPKSAAASVSTSPQVLFTGQAEEEPPPAANGPPPREPLHVAVVGDSLSDYRSHGGGFIRFLEAQCPESRFDNLGKGGDMTNQMRRRFERVLAEQHPAYTHVIVFGGVNDLYSDLTAGRTNKKISADLTAMYRAARQVKAQVIALTVTPWGGFKRHFTPHRGENTLALNRWIVEQEGLLVDVALDAYPLLSCGTAELCEPFRAPFGDGLHFGPSAHDLLGKRLYEAAFSNCL